MNKIPKSIKITAAIAAAFIAFVYVWMGVFIRIMDQSFTTNQQVYLRLLLAGLLALAIFRNKFNGLFKNISGKDWGIYVGRSFIYYSLGVGVATVAVQRANLSTVAFIASLPIAGLVAWIMFKEKVPIKSLPFVAISIIGLGLVAGISFGNLTLGIGELAAVFSMLAFNIGYLMARLHNKNKNNFENTTILLLLAWIPYFVLTIFSHERLFPESVTTAALLALFVSAIMNVVITFLVNYVFVNLKAYVAANILLLEGFFALIIGFMLYGEKPSLTAAVGGLIIVGCAFAINKIESVRKQ